MAQKFVSSRSLETLEREELVGKVRSLLAEADALSSRISAVNEIGVAINRELNLNKIVATVGRQAKWLLDFDHLSICLRDEETRDWQVRVLYGEPISPVDDWTQTETLGKVLLTNQPLLLKDGTSATFLADYPSQIMIPLTTDGKSLGAIVFACKTASKYNTDDMRIAYILSLQLSPAIRNAQVLHQLERTQQELKLRVEELDAYSHTIAHDLKSPLTSVMLSGEIVLMKYADVLPQDAVESINLMRDSASQMSSMVDQLLMLARLQDLDEMITTVNVRYTVDRAVARFAPIIEEKNVTLQIADKLPDVLGHAQWVEEIFANYISNAIKYMGADNFSPCIKVYSSDELIGDGFIRYNVQDNGVGISAEAQEKLFEMFTRLHTVKAEGLGLGLSIVKRIMGRLNGRLGVESTPGKGSTFWFALPIADKRK